MPSLQTRHDLLLTDQKFEAISNYSGTLFFLILENLIAKIGRNGVTSSLNNFEGVTYTVGISPQQLPE